MLNIHCSFCYRLFNSSAPNLALSSKKTFHLTKSVKSSQTKKKHIKKKKSHVVFRNILEKKYVYELTHKLFCLTYQVTCASEHLKNRLKAC